MKISVIAIGRNEGERLRACLESLARFFARSAGDTGKADERLPIIYVDSGSTDGSVELARGMGIEVVSLDMSKPFSAARARNAGFARSRELWPDLQYVQFVDGDCTVSDGWLESAMAFLANNPDYAAVCGRRRERYPEASVYNRLFDIEWNTPIGDANACGGDAMFQVAAFEQVGGFDPTVTAGEEPELCIRLRAKGWKIRRIDHEMTLHDAATTRFAQWWRRAVRGGYGGTDVATRFEKGKGAFSREVRSARMWGIGWPVCVVGTTVVAWGAGLGSVGICVTAVCALAVLPLQMLRVAVKARRRCGDMSTALAYGILIMLGKWAHLVGQYRLWRDRRAGRHPSLIEYKGAAAT